MRDHGRAETALKYGGRTERDTDTGEYQCQPDVAGTPHRVDVRDTEQDSLEQNRQDGPHPTEEPAQDEPAEHELFDDRGGDHGRRRGGDQIRPVGIELTDALDIATQWDVEGEDDRRHHRLGRDRSQPGERSPSEVAPAEPPSDRCQPAGAPATTNVPPHANDGP